MDTNIHSQNNLIKKAQTLILDQIRVIIASATVILIIWFLILNPYFSSFSISNTTTAQIKNLIFTELQQTDKLVTITTSPKATVNAKTEKRLGDIYLGETHVIYEGVGQIQAGMDFNDIEVLSINEEKKTIRLRLPQAELINVFLDINKSQTIDNYRKWFGSQDYAQLQSEAQKKSLLLIEKEACQQKILDAANNQAKVIITSILKKVGYQEITIDTNSAQASICKTIS